MSSRALGLSACIVAAVLTLACGNSNPLGPSQNSVPEVVNVADDFEFQLVNVTGVTHTYTYTWTNSGTIAVVTHSDGVNGGSATLVLRDASGTVRGTIDLKSSGTFTTPAGTSGLWQVQLQLVGVDGSVNLKIQKG